MAWHELPAVDPTAQRPHRVLIQYEGEPGTKALYNQIVRLPRTTIADEEEAIRETTVPHKIVKSPYRGTHYIDWFGSGLVTHEAMIAAVAHELAVRSHLRPGDTIVPPTNGFHKPEDDALAGTIQGILEERQNGSPPQRPRTCVAAFSITLTDAIQTARDVYEEMGEYGGLVTAHLRLPPAFALHETGSLLPDSELARALEPVPFAPIYACIQEAG